MTNVSELTREMISDYEAMVGRKLTPQEYLQFRNQAMIELQNGFSATANTSVYPTQTYIPFSYPLPTPQPIASINNATTVMATTPTSEDVIKEPVREVVTKEPRHKAVTVEIETPSNIEEDDESVNPFFALIDKIDA